MTLKKGDRVLGFDDFNHPFLVPDIFCSINNRFANRYVCFKGNYKYCIPYNGNEHLELKRAPKEILENARKDWLNNNK